MRTPLRTFLLLLLLQAVPGRMLLSLIATSVPKGHRRHPVQRPFEPTLLATDCAVNRRTHKLPLNRTLMTSKAAPVTHVAPVQTATPRLLPMTRTCLALSLELVGPPLDRAKVFLRDLHRRELNATQPWASARSIGSRLGWTKRDLAKRDWSSTQGAASWLLTGSRLQDWLAFVHEEGHAPRSE